MWLLQVKTATSSPAREMNRTSPGTVATIDRLRAVVADRRSRTARQRSARCRQRLQACLKACLVWGSRSRGRCSMLRIRDDIPCTGLDHVQPCLGTLSKSLPDGLAAILCCLVVSLERAQYALIGHFILAKLQMKVGESDAAQQKDQILGDITTGM